MTLKKIKIEYIIIPLILGLISYVTSNSFIIMGVITVLSIVYFFTLFDMKRKKFHILYDKFDSCFNFINNFIITIDSKQTLLLTLESVTPTMDEEFLEEYNGVIHLEEMERLEYLKKYYSFYIYDLFINIVQLYVEKGGNILDMSSHLLNEMRIQQDINHQSYSISKRKVVDFIVLWFFSLVILVILRFALNEYYSLISSKIIFQVLVGLLFVFLLFSIEMIARKIFYLEKRGNNYEENSER